MSLDCFFFFFETCSFVVYHLNSFIHSITVYFDHSYVVTFCRVLYYKFRMLSWLLCFNNSCHHAQKIPIHFLTTGPPSLYKYLTSLLTRILILISIYLTQRFKNNLYVTSLRKRDCSRSVVKRIRKEFSYRTSETGESTYMRRVLLIENWWGPLSNGIFNLFVHVTLASRKFKSSRSLLHKLTAGLRRRLNFIFSTPETTQLTCWHCWPRARLYKRGDTTCVSRRLNQRPRATTSPENGAHIPLHQA